MTNSCRRPPLPFFRSPKGICRWCGSSIAPPLRNWHPKCAAAYKLAINSGSQRNAVWQRDKGVCACCGKSPKGWQADHITPLHSIPPSQLEDYPACLRFWSIDNLQTLCTVPCHQNKTAREATSRAKVLRLRKKQLPREQRQESRFRKKVINRPKKSIPSRHKPVISYLQTPLCAVTK